MIVLSNGDTITWTDWHSTVTGSTAYYVYRRVSGKRSFKQRYQGTNLNDVMQQIRKTNPNVIFSLSMHILKGIES